MDSHVVLLVLFFLSDVYFFRYAVAGRRGGRDKMTASISHVARWTNFVYKLVDNSPTHNTSKQRVSSYMLISLNVH